MSSLLRSPIRTEFDRLILVSLSGFLPRAVEQSRREAPIALELFDYAALTAWVDRLRVSDEDAAGEVEFLVRAISHKFAELIAKNPRTLMSLKWRDLERTVARIMEGLGFSVVLTPPSKDGGKDLVLSFEASNRETSYIVELKQWRAGNRVGPDAVSSFLSVIVREQRSGGLFLSTSGYTQGAFEGLTEIQRRTLKFGATEKIVALAKTYTRAEAGLWTPPAALDDILFEGTE